MSSRYFFFDATGPDWDFGSSATKVRDGYFSRKLNLAGHDFTFAGTAGVASTFTLTGATNVTFPTAGTLVTTTGTGATGTWSISITGNAATAAKLQTARTINGLAFDGSANVAGAFTAGTWAGGVIAGQYGGTGVANTGKTFTMGGNLATVGAFASTFTMTGVTNVTFPTAGTLATLAGVETLTNKTLTDPIITSLNGGGQLSGRNKIINGAMEVSQRYEDLTVVYSGGQQYFIDRWLAVASLTGKFSMQQSVTAGPPGFPKSLAIVSLSAYTPTGTDINLVGYKIEGHDIRDLLWGTAAAKPLTIQFLVTSPVAGLHGGSIFNFSGSQNYVFSYTVNAANTWEWKTVTIPGPTSGVWEIEEKTGLQFYFNLGSGPSSLGTPGTWGATNVYGPTGAVNCLGTSGNVFRMTGFQAETGSVATAFEHEPYAVTYAKCLRYCWVMWPRNTNSPMWQGTVWTAADGYAVVRFPVKMRATPSANFSSAGNFTLLSKGATWSLTALSAGTFSKDCVELVGSVSSAPLTVGQSFWIRAGNANAEVIMSCEL